MNKADGERNLSKMLAVIAAAASILPLLSIGGDLRFPALACWVISWGLMYEACCMFETMANNHIRFCTEKDKEIAELKAKLYARQKSGT